jgi:putative PEP-CTERM system histidine kinase
MIATLILWTHALAALLFGAFGVAELRGRDGQGPRRGFAIALLLTALWALTVAGIDAHDVSAGLAQAIRDIAWLVVTALLARRVRIGGVAMASLYAVVGAILVLAAVIALAQDQADAASGVLAATADILRMMALLAALMLLHHLAHAGAIGVHGDQRLFALALGSMWSVDLVVTVVTLAQGTWPDLLIVVRGGAMTGVAILLAAAALRRDGSGTPAVSRAAIVRALAVLAVLLYAGATAVVADAAAALTGEQGRLVQTAIVIGATAALLALVSTPWLRAWVRVKLAKHLFSHRYDYRIEWQRFTATLAQGGEATPLGVRVVKAVADLTDSPAGLLLLTDEEPLAIGAAWNWPAPTTIGSDPAFVAQLAGGRIVALDPIRAGRDAGSAPAALLNRDEAWVVVPLLHGEALAGAIVLARPPIDRMLDWEDLDLLRVVGRQAASYLAEDRAHVALADAARFDEFNRRFAFLLHDMKNVVSQLSLVARNAERHADNPDFRADMIATLRESAERMTTLLARLGRTDAGRAEPAQPVDVAALVARVAVARRAQHPIELDGGAAIAMAQPARLEQALGHLLQNAAEASAPGMPVAVRVVAGAAVRIDVEDRGCGMSPAFVRDQLFRPFASSKPAGFGIGAYEARELVRAMGGTLTVDSREGEGTRFAIVLPAAPAVEVAA